MNQRRYVLSVTIVPAAAILLLGLLELPALLCGQISSGPPSGQLQSTVDQLIVQLDSNKRVERVRSERDLVRLGPRILPLLPYPERFSSASVRAALRRIRVRLEREKAHHSILPSQVDLQGRFSLDQILKQLSQQTSNTILFDGLERRAQDRLLSVDWRQKPFWQAMDNFLTLAEWHMTADTTRSGIRLQSIARAKERQESHIAYSGAYRISVYPAKFRPIFGDEQHLLLSLPLQIMAEPRLRPLFLKYSSNDITAGTDANVQLQPLDPEAKYELPVGIEDDQIRRSAVFRIPVAYRYADVELKGKLTMLTAAGAEGIIFRDLPTSVGVSRRRGGVVVELLKAAFHTTANSGYSARIRVAVTYDTGGPAFESHRTWMYHNDVYLITTTGHRLEVNDGFETNLQLDGAVVIEYRFKNLTELPATYRFTYVVPSLLIDVPIEFEFSKINVARTRE